MQLSQIPHLLRYQYMRKIIDYFIKIQLKAEFLALDSDGDGDISVEDLETLLLSAKRQLKMTNKEISRLMKDVDKNGDGSPSRGERFAVVELAGKLIPSEDRKNINLDASDRDLDNTAPEQN